MIEIRNIEDIPVKLCDPEGNCIGIIKTQLQFLDIRCQILNEKLEGYYIIFNEEVIMIDYNGRLDSFPKGLFDTMDKFLDILIRL